MNEIVKDEHQREYELEKKLLGEGGQGRVFRVRDSRLVVKLLNKTSERKREQLRNQLTAVKRMDLQDMHIARPIAMLSEPHLGYVMELLDDMIPIQTLMKPEADLAEWYIQTGGLRRRLNLLAQAASLLNQLHGKGLVYADPSPDNIFISQDVHANEVWLIDADNLRYQSSPADEAIYTPGYGAPELVQNRSGVNTLTDAHAFAVIAFKVLSLVHPLLGDYVNDGEPELEDQALCGKLPWIDHAEDDLNRSSNGIPREMVLSPRLQELAQRTFAEGLTDSQKRPSLSEWAEKLFLAENNTLLCSECGSSYYFKEKVCPWCDHPRPAFAILRALLWNTDAKEPDILRKADKKEQVFASLFIGEGEKRYLTEQFLFGKNSNISHFQIELNHGELTIQVNDNKEYRLLASGGEELLSNQARVINLSAASEIYSLHLGTPEQNHRVIRFQYQEATQ